MANIFSGGTRKNISNAAGSVRLFSSDGEIVALEVWRKINGVWVKHWPDITEIRFQAIDSIILGSEITRIDIDEELLNIEDLLVISSDIARQTTGEELLKVGDLLVISSDIQRTITGVIVLSINEDIIIGADITRQDIGEELLSINEGIIIGADIIRKDIGEELSIVVDNLLLSANIQRRTSGEVVTRITDNIIISGNVLKINTADLKPAAVTNLRLTGEYSQVTARWNRAERAIGYIIEWRLLSQEFDISRQIANVGIDNTTRIINLQTGQDYEIKVYGRNSNGDGIAAYGRVSTLGPTQKKLMQPRNFNFTRTIDPPPPVPLPATPQNLTLAPGNENLNISWASVPSATLYIIQWKSGSEVYNSDREYRTNLTTYLLEGLSNGVQYDVRVAAINSTGRGGYNTQSGTPRAPIVLPPGIPQGFSLVAGDTSITASWTRTSRATSYLIQYKDISQRWNEATEIRTSSISRVIQNLINGLQYNMRIAAINSGGQSGYSNILNAEPRVPQNPSVNVTVREMKNEIGSGSNLSRTFPQFYQGLFGDVSITELSDSNSYNNLQDFYEAVAFNFLDEVGGSQNISETFERSWDACAYELYGGTIFNTGQLTPLNQGDLAACRVISAAWNAVS